MRDLLARGGLPAQYAAVGFVAGVLILTLSRLTGWYEADLGTIPACTVGAALGGVVRRWVNKGG